jgi:hypothetical protein
MLTWLKRRSRPAPSENMPEYQTRGSLTILDQCLSAHFDPPTWPCTSKSENGTATVTWEIGNGLCLVAHLNLRFGKDGPLEIQLEGYVETAKPPGDAT